jgi:hypothetical protein
VQHLLTVQISVFWLEKKFKYLLKRSWLLTMTRTSVMFKYSPLPAVSPAGHSTGCGEAASGTDT